jgi:hypothetical protein
MSEREAKQAGMCAKKKVKGQITVLRKSVVEEKRSEATRKKGD